MMEAHMAGPPGFEAGPPLEPLTRHTGPDPAELGLLLPPRARQRLEVLTLRREDAYRLIPEGETIRQLNAERFKAERHLQTLQAPATDGGHSLPVDDIRCVVAKRNVDKLTDEAAALSERYAARGAAFQAIARVHANAMAWIRDGRPPGSVMADHDGPEPRLHGKESLLDAVERLRRRGRELKADLTRISAAPFPSSHVKAKMRQEIEVLAHRGAPSMALAVEHDREIVWPR
jgi:hypothetical protein